MTDTIKVAVCERGEHVQIQRPGDPPMSRYCGPCDDAPGRQRGSRSLEMVERTYVLEGTERDANEVDALREQRDKFRDKAWQLGTACDLLDEALDEARAEVERLREALRLVIERDEAATDFDGRHNLGIAARVAREELGEKP